MWPEAPADLGKWGKESRDLMDREREVEGKRQRAEERFKLEPEDAAALRERARGLLGGKIRWRPSWEEIGGQSVVAMGRVGGGGR